MIWKSAYLENIIKHKNIDIMIKYGSKDIMRMESIKEKSRGDYMSQLLHAYNMACAITLPGKAMARGYAAQEVFGEHSAVSQIFFERAYDLGGEDVRPVASVNPFDTSEEGIEAEYENIPIEQQPASRRSERKEIGDKHINRKAPWPKLIPLGKINTIKGDGPQFSLYGKLRGTMEVWQTEDGKYRLAYTAHYETLHFIGETRTFNVEGKLVEWTLVDYIESEYTANLAPLYGKSIPIYNYD